ncbi:MAG: hypothetical protein NT007_03140 [Candidatus Kapabacteria bacterium]|nr:hypothetical protein [Candidatus Kapabacteria bacterium]
MNPSKRNYNMTDAELCMFTSNLVNTMTRDQTEFTASGVTALMVTAMETLGNAFEVFPADAFYYADYLVAVETKNTHRETCTLKLREIVGYAKMKWGSTSPQVKKFDAGDLSKDSDLAFLSKCRLAVATATSYLTDLTSVGLTDPKIDALEAAAQLFEDAMNDIATAQEIRDIKTQERIEKGNELYALVARYCEIGKIIWEDVNEAKYNDYVIYGSSGLGKPQNLTANWVLPETVVTLNWDEVTGASSYQIYTCAVNFGLPSDSYTLLMEAPGPQGVAFVADKRNYYKIRATNSSAMSDYSDEAWTEVVINV